MDASRVRQSLARVLEQVRAREESVVIVRYGQPLAALVPLSRLPRDERRSLDRQNGRPAREVAPASNGRARRPQAREA